MKLSPEAVARASSRHPWATVGVWVAAIAVAGYLASTFLAEALTTDIDFTDRPEAVQARDLIEKMRGEQKLAEFVVVVSETRTVGDAEYAQFVGRL